MWKIKMSSGEEFVVEEREARAAIQAMEKKVPVSLSRGSLNGSFMESVMDQNDPRNNPIINDEDFRGWLSGDYRKLDALNNRYSGDKYDKEWKDALTYKKLVESGEVKLIGKTDDTV